MKRSAAHGTLSVAVLAMVAAIAGLNGRPAVAGYEDEDWAIAPIRSMPGGQTYGRWAAEWWQWALGIPAAVNPLTDTAGEHCVQRQVDQVWFLAGSTSPAPIVRACEVPVGKALFFPLINLFYGALLNDPPETRTEAFVRAAGRCTEAAQISVWIDGHKVPSQKVGKAGNGFTGISGSPSPIFNVQLPPDNLFGLDEAAAPELVVSPTAEQGYYLFLRPLSRGHHTIRWIASGCSPGFSQDVTYHLSIIGPSQVQTWSEVRAEVIVTPGR